MSLNDLNREVYSTTPSDISNRTHEKSSYDPEVTTTGNSSPFEGNESWNKLKEDERLSSRKKNIWIGVLIFFLISLAVGGGFFYQWWTKNAFHQDRVIISLEGPKETDSTKLSKYIIHYTNNNRVTLKNAEIWLTYSENFQPTDNVNLKYLNNTAGRIFVGDIKPMISNQVELSGVFYAPKDFPAYLQAELHFVPSNGKDELMMNSQIGINITSSPVSLEVSGPRQAANNDGIEYVIGYENLDTKSVGDLQLQVEFPAGFEMTSSDPKLIEKNSSWYIGNLEPGQIGKVIIRGVIKGDLNEMKNINVSLGRKGENDKLVLYDKQDFITSMISPALSIAQKLDGKDTNIINNGEVLRYLISYQNTSDTGLRDVIVSVKIDGKILDFSKINVEKGSYDSNTGLITWKASDVPSLANIEPKGGGTLHFSIPVKNIIPIDSKFDKNFTVSSIAKIDSPDILTTIESNKVIGSNKLELKLASKVFFDTKGYYMDSKIKNTGPIPMETGKETTFTLHWKVSSVSDDVVDSKVISSLPSGVRWIGQVFPANENISYNERTNQLTWDAGTVLAGAGVLIPAREVSFQVGITPQINQIGDKVNLLNESVFTGKDNFVDQDVSLNGAIKDTMLSEDMSVGYAHGKVLR